jgi:Outer membrane protein beta-barrel domain
MKQIITFSLLILGFTVTSFGQSEAHDKLENQKYYQTFIKDNIVYMKDYVDSTNVKMMLNQMETINEKIGTELEKIILPEMPAIDAEVISEDMETAEENVTLGGDGEVESDQKIEDLLNTSDDDDSESPLDKFIPMRKKESAVKTHLIINFGLNLLGDADNIGVSPVAFSKPKAATWSSWFWEYGIQSRARIGGQNSKMYFLYGLTYLRNRFTWDNDVQLVRVIDQKGDVTPRFNDVEDLKSKPKFRTSYVTVPLGFRFKIAKKTYLDIGGYLGYNLKTSQTHEFEINDEEIITKRSGDYGVNKWMYGATAGIKVWGTRIIVKYNLSNLFVSNNEYNTKLIMVGFQSSI